MKRARSDGPAAMGSGGGAAGAFVWSNTLALHEQHQVTSGSPWAGSRAWSERGEGVAAWADALHEEQRWRIQSQRELGLITRVARALDASNDYESSLRRVLATVCEESGWAMAEAWTRDPGRSHLELSAVWHGGGEADRMFHRRSRRCRVLPGLGLVGCVWKKREACWFPVLSQEQGFRRRRVAEAARLRSALGVPVSTAGEVMAVLMFFMREPVAEAGRLGELLSVVGLQLGNLFRLKQMEELLHRIERQIGQDLHDGLSQQLAGSGHLAHVLCAKLDLTSRPEAVTAARIVELLREAGEQVRSVARGLMPVKSAPDGLVRALRQLAGCVKSTYSKSCVFRGRAPIRAQDNGVATHLYRIAQEAVNNALRHANADRITIRLYRNREGLHLVVEDDGSGMPTAIHLKKGMGMETMECRARAIHARLTLESERGRGTRLHCLLPRGTLGSAVSSL
jgi:signal transduction histidine kinase